MSILSGNFIGDANDYMSPAYVARYGSEPAVQQKAERQKQATAQRDIEAEIKRVYPKWATEPLKMRMKHGAIVTTGFDNVFAAICSGRAELVQP